VKGHLTGFGVSILLHGALLLAVVPLFLWQNKLGLPKEQPITLSLAQFAPAPPAPAPAPPEPVASPPVAQPKPEPPKTEPKPPAKPKPVEKPKPAEKPVEKPKPKPKPEKQHEPPPAPMPEAAPLPEPAPVKAIAPPPPAVARPAPRQVATPAAKPVTPPAPVADNGAAEAAYRQKLQSLIAARKQYPRMAEKAEVEGTVTVSFTVLPNGTISGARVSQSSGNEWLDKAAVQAVNATSGALPFPAGIHKAQWDFALKVNFKLDW
jgi:protein TonB